MTLRAMVLSLALLMPLSAQAHAIHADKRDISVLARTIQGEAGAESERGQIAVAHVLLNRIKQSEDRTDSTIERAALRKGQFQVWSNKKLLARLVRENKQYAQMKSVAEKAVSLYLSGHDFSHGAIAYCRVDKRPRWARHMRVVTKVGKHVFFA